MKFLDRGDLIGWLLIGMMLTGIIFALNDHVSWSAGFVISSLVFGLAPIDW